MTHAPVSRMCSSNAFIFEGRVDEVLFFSREEGRVDRLHFVVVNARQPRKLVHAVRLAQLTEVSLRASDVMLGALLDVVDVVDVGGATARLGRVVVSLARRRQTFFVQLAILSALPTPDGGQTATLLRRDVTLRDRIDMRGEKRNATLTGVS